MSRLNVDLCHGIEIDEFPALIAETALWMADHIANTRLAEDYGKPYARIPLVTAPGIRHADALEIDWNSVLPADRCSLCARQPAVPGSEVPERRAALAGPRVGEAAGCGGTLDYVAAWFLKAGAYVAGGEGTRIGFVATNSITQGEQVAQLWPTLFGRYALEIAFAHRTFAWPGRAAVHCVIVGLAPRGSEPSAKRLFSYGDIKGESTESDVPSITAYLFGAATADRHEVVESIARPINGAPQLLTGSKPVDGGYLIFSANERAALLSKYPTAVDWLRPFVGAQEYINGGMRWILLGGGLSPAEIRANETVAVRLRQVRAFRMGTLPKKSKVDTLPDPISRTTAALADFPTSYHVTVIPDRPFLVIPQTSSENRHYIPIAWMEPPVIPSDKLRILPDASLWHFGILTSTMHMAWMRAITGRMKSDYMYSVGVVYNTFPWPDAASAQVAKVEALARAVLDARALPKNATSTLADLYNPDFMPAELRKAHAALDAAVDRLYRPAGFNSDRARVEHLFTRYRALVEPTSAAAALNRRTVRRVRTAAP